MSRVLSSGTEPEKIFRNAQRLAGIRSFRICDSTLPGKPDIVLPSKRLAIFIDGDFWHGHQYKTRGFESWQAQLSGIHNEEYWSGKISRNVARDLENTSALLRDGWSVLRFWERDVRASVENCVATVRASLAGRMEKVNLSALPFRTAAELFAGIGLVRLALDRAGWTTAFANDNDPNKLAMYAANFGNAGLDPRDVHRLTAKDLPNCALLTASFPCNDLSLAGARAGLSGPHSSAFWAVIKLLEARKRKRPPLVLLENVAGFLTSNGGKDFEDALVALSRLGYSCDALLMDASDFTPQSRVRLFVVAHQGGESIPTDAPFLVSSMRPPALVDFINAHPNVNWGIRRLPAVNPARKLLESVLEDVPTNDARWWNRERSQYFMNQLSPRHLRIAEHMIEQANYTYGTAFRRVRKGKSMAELRVDGIAGCLRTPRGGSGRQILFKAGQGQYQVRLLTPRECARLQGVCDEEFKITVRDNQALFGFGDAVCVPVVQWIAENYLNPLVSELMRGRILYPQNREVLN